MPDTPIPSPNDKRQTVRISLDYTEVLPLVDELNRLRRRFPSVAKEFLERRRKGIFYLDRNSVTAVGARRTYKLKPTEVLLEFIATSLAYERHIHSFKEVHNAS